MPRWIVAKTKGSRERYAAENVERQGYKTYLPRHVVRRGRGSLYYSMTVPIFSSYLPVYIHDDKWRFLLGTYGVTSVIMRHDGPATLPLSVVARLRSMENENGLILLPAFPIGAKVRISDGVAKDQFGIYQGQTPKERARVLMEWLGGKRTVEMDYDCLELAS